MNAETCGSCGITHKSVECSGIWHCPNALCLGSGGGYFRITLKSYKDNHDGTHSVDRIEWRMKGIIHNLKKGIYRFRFYRVRDKLMSGECDRCSEHAIECRCVKTIEERLDTLEIDLEQLTIIVERINRMFRQICRFEKN